MVEKTVFLKKKRWNVWSVWNFAVPLHHQTNKKEKIMSLGIFICICVAIMVIDTINDPKFKEKIKNLEE